MGKIIIWDFRMWLFAIINGVATVTGWAFHENEKKWP